MDAGPYTFLAADALMTKVREGGRVVKVATAVNANGYRDWSPYEVERTHGVDSTTGSAARPRATWRR